MSINYETLSKITVKSQEELDMIPENFKGVIYIEFGTSWEPAVVTRSYPMRVVAWGNSSVEARGNSSVMAWGNSSVEARGNSSVMACGNSSVVARDNSSVEAWGNSSVAARGNSSVEAWGNSSVEAWDNSSVVACGNSSVVARDNSSVEARDNSSVVACENSSVEARDNSSVVACENSSVVARDNSSVEARGNSSVMAWGNSSVVACGNSSVEACGNSSVVARDNSSVEAWGNSQIVDRLYCGRINISGNARIVHMPKTIMEYCDFYGLKHDKKTGRFFKCVHKVNGRYLSDNDGSFEYVIGEKAIPDSFDNNPERDCGHGIHVAHLNWVLDYGRNWSDIAIIEVEAKLKDVVLPNRTVGKVRCKEVTVIREVPLEECGLYGKMLAKRLSANK